MVFSSISVVLSSLSIRLYTRPDMDAYSDSAWDRRRLQRRRRPPSHNNGYAQRHIEKEREEEGGVRRLLREVGE